MNQNLEALINKIDYNKELVFVVRAYFTPFISLVIILLAIFFLYIPSINGIQNDIATINSNNTTFNQEISKANFYQNLNSSSTSSVDDNINVVNQILPDDAKSAYLLNSLQSLSQTYNIKIISSTANLAANDGYNKNTGLKPHSDGIVYIEANVNVEGTPQGIFDFLNALSKLKPTVSIMGVSFSGQLVTSGPVQAKVVLQSYSLNSSLITKNYNLLSNINTSYTSTDINKL